MGHAAIKLTDKWQLTIPTRLRDKIAIKPGDYLEPELKRGVLILKPRKQILIDPDQAWFWNKEWQEKEREVNEEVRQKRIKRAHSVKALMKDLLR